MSLIHFFHLLILALSPSWTLAFEDDNIKGFTRKVEHSKYLEYKLEMTCKGSVQDVLDLITDIDNYKTIYPYLSKTELLSEQLPEQFDVLVVIDTPFPAKNRIGVYSNKIEYVSSEEVHISIIQKSELIPDSKYVKIEECYGSWLIKSTDVKVTITHQFFADPGGTIPAWIINAFALKEPKNTFKILRKQLEK